MRYVRNKRNVFASVNFCFVIVQREKKPNFWPKRARGGRSEGGWEGKIRCSSVLRGWKCELEVFTMLVWSLIDVGVAWCERRTSE